MSIIEAIILGVIQGATEFLPISSSGHLVLLPVVFNLPAPDLTMVGLLHLGTLAAILIYFWRDLWLITKDLLMGLKQQQPMGSANARLGWYIAVGTIPAVTAGLLLNDFFEEVFATPTVAAAMLLVTAGLLVAGEKMMSGDKSVAAMTWTDGIIIGVFQMFALMPGISRSGSTIVGGLFRGLDRPTAARYSFLLGVPVILGAGLLSLTDIMTADQALYSTGAYVAAFLSAAVFGYLCILFLLKWVQKHSLYIFAAYCAVVGTVFLVGSLFL